VLNRPDTGLHILGELYEAANATLAVLDRLESIGEPGNDRMVVQVVPLTPGQDLDAWMFVKDPVLAWPVHSGHLANYQDRRFIPPDQR
jgi:gamma-glutamylaminecyclotransferase